MDNGSQKELHHSADIISAPLYPINSDCRRIGKEATTIDVSAVNKENSAIEMTNACAPTIFRTCVQNAHN